MMPVSGHVTQSSVSFVSIDTQCKKYEWVS